MQEGGEGGLDELAGLREGGLDSGAEGFAKLGGTGAEGELKGGVGDGVVEVAGEGEQFGCTGVVGGDGLRAGGGGDGEELDGAGGGVDRAIDEEDGLGVGDLFGEFRGPLLAGDDAQAGVGGEVIFDPVGEPGAEAVIAAEGVAAGEDEASRLFWIHRDSV